MRFHAADLLTRHEQSGFEAKRSLDNTGRNRKLGLEALAKDSSHQHVSQFNRVPANSQWAVVLLPQ